MSDSTINSEQLLASIVPEWRSPESPEAFLWFFRADRAYFHRAFVKWLGVAGFEMRRITKRANHHARNLHLLRGTVRPGCEDETARQVISTTRQRCGCDCRNNEIEGLRDRQSSWRGFDSQRRERRVARFPQAAGLVVCG